jgi:AraC-like DNA-binding protein
LLRDFVVALTDRLPTMRADEAPVVAVALRDVLAACLRPSADAAARAQPQLDMLAFRRAERIIDANLHRPDWGPEELRRALGVSRSTLYRVFEPSGGVAEHIRARRLARAHALLRNSNGGRRISEIGRACGFASEAHFSRAFRQAYGHTAREVMAFGGRASGGAARQRRAHGGAMRDPEHAPFVDWIRSLRSAPSRIG